MRATRAKCMAAHQGLALMCSCVSNKTFGCVSLLPHGIGTLTGVPGPPLCGRKRAGSGLAVRRMAPAAVYIERFTDGAGQSVRQKRPCWCRSVGFRRPKGPIKWPALLFWPCATFLLVHLTAPDRNPRTLLWRARHKRVASCVQSICWTTTQSTHRPPPMKSWSSYLPIISSG